LGKNWRGCGKSKDREKPGQATHNSTDTYTKKHAAEYKEAHQEKGVVVIGYENIVRESSKELIKAYGTVLSRRMGLFVWGRILL
jgi:hypothetical protein